MRREGTIKIGYDPPKPDLRLRSIRKGHTSQFSHEPLRFREGADDAQVVADVVVTQLAAPAVLQPLLGRLVAADEEGPGRCGYVVEVLGVVDPHPAGGGGLVGQFEAGAGFGQFAG